MSETGTQLKRPSDVQMEICNCNVYMIEIQDLEGVQERCPPKEDQHLKKKKYLLASFFG